MNADYIVRGIRTAQDYEYERAMRQINADMHPAVGTVFLIPPREYIEVSSTLVKGLIGPSGWQKIVARYLPEEVLRLMLSWEKA